MTEALPKMPWRWDGECLHPPTAYWAREADKRLVVGETYTLAEILERSGKSHAAYFAQVHEFWQSLPEGVTDTFANEDHLRRHALIQTGFRDERTVSCASKAEALRTAALVRSLDGYAIVVVRDCVVIILTAKSQDYRSMDRATFQASKTAVLDYLSDLIGSDPADLSSSGRAAA